MQREYEHPLSNHRETDGMTCCGLIAFLVGPLYFAVRGNWSWFFISILLVIPTLGLSVLTIPFFARKINRKHLLKQGYTEC